MFASFVRPLLLYGSEAWCQKECVIGILCRTERSMVRATCEVQLNDRSMKIFRFLDPKIYRFDVWFE